MGGDGPMKILVVVVADQWIRAASEHLGRFARGWTVRHQTASLAQEVGVGDTANGDHGHARRQTFAGTDTAVDVAEDDAAPAACNAQLAALPGIAPRGTGAARPRH